MITYEKLKNTFPTAEQNIFGFGTNNYVCNSLQNNIILTNPRTYPLTNMYIIFDPFNTDNMIKNFTITTKARYTPPKKITSLRSYCEFIQTELMELLKSVSIDQMRDPSIFKTYLLNKFGFRCMFNNIFLNDVVALNKVIELLGIHITIFENTWNQSPQCTYCSSTICDTDNSIHLYHVSKYINNDILLSNSVDLCGVYMTFNDKTRNIDNANFTYFPTSESNIEHCVTLKNKCELDKQQYFDIIQNQFALLLSKIKNSQNGGKISDDYYYKKYLKYKNKYVTLNKSMRK